MNIMHFPIPHPSAYSSNCFNSLDGSIRSLGVADSIRAYSFEGVHLKQKQIAAALRRTVPPFHAPR